MKSPIVPARYVIPGMTGKDQRPTKIIKVSTKNIGANATKTANGAKRGFDPAIIVQTPKNPTGLHYDFAFRVDILDDRGNVVASILQNDLRPEISGARVWIETKAELRISTEEAESNEASP